MHITYISTYVPRKCGIATYTRDLSSENSKRKNKVSIYAMENPLTPYKYTKPVTQTISQENKEAYILAALNINKSNTEIVHIQHEFGLFGGADGEYILELAKNIKKPLVVTFHTVLFTPTDNQKYIIQELSRLSRSIVVMEEIAKDRLQNIYGISPRDITIIYHGAPEVNVAQSVAKKKLGYPDSFILLANNLVSRNKGFEYAIEAVALAIKEIPKLLFLIVGETHPLVREHEGESYRKELQELIKKYNLSKNVILVDKYISALEIERYFAACDVYITPYLDPQQITSGTLAYAVGAGKVCIATEYVYAKKMLTKGRGILVPFRDGSAIATALIDLYKNPKKRKQIEKQTKTIEAGMSWVEVAAAHIKLYSQLLNLNNTIHSVSRSFLKKEIDIYYLMFLTDGVGVMQHSYLTIPDNNFGYSTDDNARALIVVSQLDVKNNLEIQKLIRVYMGFLKFASVRNGAFHTFLNYNREWTDVADIPDAYGKAVMALGHYVNADEETNFTQVAKNLFEASMEQIGNIRDLRTAAYCMLGLYYYIQKYGDKTDSAINAMDFMKKLADFLVTSYEKHKDSSWEWFENDMTYDNFRLPQALFAAYIILEDERYKQVAELTLKFATDINFNKDLDCFDFVGQDGWYKKGGKKADYDQQPLEAGGAVDAFLFAKRASNDKKYLKYAFLAFEWFFGRNRNNRSLYDPVTKGVYDGLNLRGVNQNQGSESIVCFLMASLALKEYT